ncbi:MAG: CCA tRNA nucleotidyltransferase [Clostridia bacterium]|nr:CCA tRNA nucleotidyltransferase [Clostridia bacterium]
MIKNSGADFIIDRLEKAGFQAFYVGGCVRNYLLGITVNDYDITTNARPNYVCEIFKDCSYFTSGIKHGTVSVVVEGNVYEITTFRTKEKYTDYRHPTSLVFCDDIHEDLSRRDFTINAIAYNKNTGIIDDFNGIYDLQNSILRSVNEPKVRFKEDALRILRGMRFCSTYNLSPEQNTKNEMINCSKYLTKIASERILSELEVIILGDNVYSVLSDFKEVLFTVIPQLNKCESKNFDLLPYFKAISNCSKSFIARFSIMLLPCKDDALGVLNALKFDGKTKRVILQILSTLSIDCNYDKIEIKKLIRNFKINTVDFIEVYAAKQIILGNSVDKIELLKLYDEIILNNECCMLSQLKVNGNDLIELGFYGVEIKDKLEKVLNLIIEEKLLNEKSVIIEYLKNYG